MIRIRKLANECDHRGDKYFLPHDMLDFIGKIEEMHYVSVKPDAIRGNHVHKTGRESVILTCTDSWRMSWMLPGKTETHNQDYKDTGVYLIEIEAGTPHAFKNTGNASLYLYCFSDLKYNPAHPDTERYSVIG